MDPLQVVFQFLKDEAYDETLRKLEEESGKKYNQGSIKEHYLRQLLGEIKITNQTGIIRELASGKRLAYTNEFYKKEFKESPVNMIFYKDYIVASFNNKSLKILDRNMEIVKSLEPNLPTMLCFARRDNILYYGTMGGEIGYLDLDTFEVKKNLVIKTNYIVHIRLHGDYLWAGGLSGFLAMIDVRSFEVVKKFDHQHAISGMCIVNNGILYSIQNDNVFHYRYFENTDKVEYYLQNPVEFVTHGFEVKDIKEGPKESTFIVLTDRNRAVIYRHIPGEKDLEVLANVSHIKSDGLTQPQMLWPLGSICISTCDDLRVVGVDIETDKVAFELKGWLKSTRCILFDDQTNELYVGAFDKTLTKFKLADVLP